MSTQTSCSALAPLIEYLDGLTSERAEAGVLQRVLSGLELTIEDLGRFVVFDPEHYCRTLIAEGPQYQILALCWSSGQCSMIHNHAESTCGIFVVQGIATETRYEMTPSGVVRPTTTHDMPQGSVCASVDDDIHQVSNYQGPGEDLVTLHVYSPGMVWADTYQPDKPGVTRVDTLCTRVD